ncbi:MAG: hypothetical protein IJP46_02905 [Prevotella sp.]|nr:hypothetical protein [Prevotella sp.]
MIVKIKNFYTRLTVLLLMLLTRIYVFAQDIMDDEDEDAASNITTIFEEEEEEIVPLGFHFGFTDILIGAVVIALFYVMSNSKLKKGCWYSVLYCILVALLIMKCT